MSKRRGWLAGLGLVLAVGLLSVALGSRGGRVEVRLVYCGFTNEPFRMSVGSKRTASLSGGIRSALLLATNSGTVPVKVTSTCKSLGPSATPARIRSSFWGTSTVLQPGDVVMVQCSMGSVGEPLQAGITYSRHGMGQRLADRALNAGNASVCALSRRILPPPKLVWAYSDWIPCEPATNRYHITAPPPEVSFDLSPPPL